MGNKTLKLIKFDSIEKLFTNEKNHRFTAELILKYLETYSNEEISESDLTTHSMLTDYLSYDDDCIEDITFYVEYYFESEKHSESLKHFIESTLNHQLVSIQSAFDEEDYCELKF